MGIMSQSACLVIKPITVYCYGFTFNYTTVDQASDSIRTPIKIPSGSNVFFSLIMTVCELKALFFVLKFITEC